MKRHVLDWLFLPKYGAGFQHLKVEVGGDMNGPPTDMWRIAEQALADPELAKCLYAIGVHYPHGAIPPSVATLRAAGGHCLRQQVHRPGIDWAKASFAYSVIGDDRWNDLQVSAEGSFESLPNEARGRGERFIGLLARWYSGATWIHFTTPQPAGYCFRLFGDGRWELTTARKVLAQGTTAAPGTGWHLLRLRCVGDRIVASLDGKPVADVRDSTYSRGLVGLVRRFHPARFDNLAVALPPSE
ncbi:MAG: hypothetical protein KJ072_05835 [Verrucomicrobia bacterium]|nr:hypothetical protein [Verrucomicrobiota bacterium]